MKLFRNYVLALILFSSAFAQSTTRPATTQPAGAPLSFESEILFPAQLAPHPFKHGLPVSGAIDLPIEREGGGRGDAWFVPAPGASAKKPAPAVIFFHGNAEITDEQAAIVRGYRGMGCSVLLAEYPGYGRSTGVPSQQTIARDADQFYDLLIKRPEVDPARVIFHGRSIGGGVAADLARRHQPVALILESSFTSVPDMAAKYGIPSVLIQSSFHTDEVVKTIKAPLLIFHGKRDEVIPVAHAFRLHKLAPGSTLVEFDCHHNDLFARGFGPAYWARIKSFLYKEEILGNRRRPAPEVATTSPGER